MAGMDVTTVLEGLCLDGTVSCDAQKVISTRSAVKGALDAQIAEPSDDDEPTMQSDIHHLPDCKICSPKACDKTAAENRSNRAFSSAWPTESTLRTLPIEIRRMIWLLVLDEMGDQKWEVVYEDFSEPFVFEEDCDSSRTGRCREYLRCQNGVTRYYGAKNPRSLERALIPDRMLYREFFSLRVKARALVLCPSLCFDWNYELPGLFLNLNDSDMFALRHGDVGGWHYQFPELEFIPPLLLNSVRELEIHTT